MLQMTEKVGYAIHFWVGTVSIFDPQVIKRPPLVSGGDKTGMKSISSGLKLVQSYAFDSTVDI